MYTASKFLNCLVYSVNNDETSVFRDSFLFDKYTGHSVPWDSTASLVFETLLPSVFPCLRPENSFTGRVTYIII